MRTLLESSLIIAIDYQEKLVPIMSNHNKILDKAKIFLTGIQMLSIPLLISQQYPKGLGETIPEIKKITPGVLTFDKTSFSVFDDDIIRKEIKFRKPESILLLGIETHICVLQSAIDLKEAGYGVYVIIDACSSRSPIDHQTGLKRLTQENIYLTTVESSLLEFIRSSKNEKFKDISKLIK